MTKKRNRSFRVDEHILEKLDQLGINASQIVRDALEDAVNTHVCPSCGSKTKIKHEGGSDVLKKKAD